MIEDNVYGPMLSFSFPDVFLGEKKKACVESETKSERSSFFTLGSKCTFQLLDMAYEVVFPKNDTFRGYQYDFFS